MKAVFLLIFFLFFFSCGDNPDPVNTNEPDPVNNTEEQPVGSGNNDVLVWSEEFNYDGAPDPKIWTVETGNGDWGWGNGEVQYYRSQNLNVSDGTLKITAKSENYGGFQYTSGRMKTQGNYSFKYGRAEIRAKLPSKQGTWPAIWLLGITHSTQGWPYCGEIDIMEQRGQPNDKSYVLGTVHWYANGNASYSLDSSPVENLSTDWHVYSMDWTEDYIKISVDDDNYYRINTNNTVPFDSRFFFLVNVAIGGTLGGNIDPNFSEDTMEIDYIRVYQ